MEAIPRNSILQSLSFSDRSPRLLISKLSFVLLVLGMLLIGTVCLVHSIMWIDKPFAGFLYYQFPEVGSFGDYQWSGLKAGVHYRDVILEVNGRPISMGKDIQAIVDQTPVGETITYRLARKGEPYTISVPVSVFTLQDFFKILIVPFLNGLIFWFIGIVVYLLKPDTEVSWVHFLFCLFLGTYLATGFEMQSTSYPPWSYYINIFSWSFLPAAAIHLGVIFPERSPLIKRWPWLPVLPYAISAFLFLVFAWSFVALASLPPGSEDKISISSNMLKVVQVSRLYALMGTLTIVGFSFYAFWRSVSVIARTRARIILLSSGVAFIPPGVMQAIVTIGKFVIPFNFVGLTVIVFPAALGFAIARHNLFDVDVYIKRTMGYILMTCVVGGTYFALQTIIRTLILNPIFGESAEQVYPLIFALLIVFLFNPLNHAVQDLVDQVFFRKKADYKDIVTSVSNALSSLLDQKAVIATLLDTVSEHLFVDRVGVIVLSAQSNPLPMFVLGEGSEKGIQHLVESHLSGEDPLVDLLSREKKLITKYEVEEDPRFVGVRDSCGQRFTELGASMALPLVHKNEVKAILALGYKKSGHFYTREEVELLETLANQGAVALENSRLADQMQKEEMVRTNLARYLSPQIVDQIIEKNVQVNLGGDRKVVTILFSDIRNFTSITETRPPDQLVAILNEYFTEMARIIFANQGSLDKYIGDALVAVFGSLIPLENSALPAARASIEMMQQMPILNEKWMRDYNFGMDIGIGLNTGEVFLGNIGSPERMEFTVIGDTVNVASRFSGLAKASEILMTRETLTALDGGLPYQELASSAVKGKAAKLEVFSLSYDLKTGTAQNSFT